ncbi:RHS repeat-associated core domain-containing protein [bacterium SCSIO 12643]|nr:RHS repeat-associated core domain-containing protein [bacterium SCSIO 12643]
MHSCSDLYIADVISTTDYYPFGSVQPGRSYTSDAYRYGFNGKEKDPEGLGGGLATYDYGFRIYNPAIARFLSVDPLTKSYPWYTPYQFAGNTPIWAIDLDGLEEAFATDYIDENGNYKRMYTLNPNAGPDDFGKVQIIYKDKTRSRILNADEDELRRIKKLREDYGKKPSPGTAVTTKIAIKLDNFESASTDVRNKVPEVKPK